MFNDRAMNLKMNLFEKILSNLGFVLTLLFFLFLTIWLIDNLK